MRENLLLLLLSKDEIDQLVEKKQAELELIAIKLHLLLCSDPNCKLLSDSTDRNYSMWIEKCKVLMLIFNIDLTRLRRAVEHALGLKAMFYSSLSSSDLARTLFVESIGQKHPNSIQNLNEDINPTQETIDENLSKMSE